MDNSEQIDKIAAALVKAQASMGVAIKDAANPFFKSKYADLSAVAHACMPALNDAGIAVLQPCRAGADGQVIVETMLLHTSGQWICGAVTMEPAKPKDPQAVGSCITYARRYSLAAMVGVLAEDDDGNQASGRGSGKTSGGRRPGPRPTSKPDDQDVTEQLVESLLEKIEKCKLYADLEAVGASIKKHGIGEPWKGTLARAYKERADELNPIDTGTGG